ncbi:MAG: hypothetical protein L0Y58_19395 [Verrucomicrobia subdivision 3 bacterium]|nr:hypothetical protein [Limisphaerales bacterium]
MKAKRIFTQNPSLLFEFSTCRDPQLERMLGNVNEFAGALVDPTSQPYCLSLLGSSGVGKSYLLEKLRAIARITPHLQRHPTLIPGACAQYRYWPEVVDDLQDWDSGRTLVRQLVDCPFLVLDDVFSPLDKSGWKAERALRILEGRKGKWTALSANATREEIAQIDTRIMSRLIRDDNVVIDVDTTDYANRPKDGLAIGFRLIDAEHRDYQAIVDRFLAAAPTLRGEGDEETILRAVETIKVGFAEPDANARRFLASELHLPLCLARRLRWVCWVV